MSIAARWLRQNIYSTAGQQRLECEYIQRAIADSDDAHEQSGKTPQGVAFAAGRRQHAQARSFRRCAKVTFVRSLTDTLFYYAIASHEISFSLLLVVFANPALQIDLVYF